MIITRSAARFKSLLLLILIVCPSLIWSQNDRKTLLDFMVPLQVLAATDEGSQKDAELRLKKIGWYNNFKTAFFALPSSVSASADCIEGDCMNGEGTVRYPAVGAIYTGIFKDGYPHERGVVINKDSLKMVVTHHEGMIWGPAALELVGDEKRAYLFVEFQSGDLAKTSNYYVSKYRLYYEGLIDDFMPYREGRLYGRGVDAECVFHDGGDIRGATGKLRYKEGVYYTGKLQWRDGDFTFSERGELHNESNNTRIEMTFLPSGRPDLRQMSIWRNDTVYAGPVDENFLPHGDRGRMLHDRKAFRYGVWEHGVYLGKYGKQRESKATFATNQESGRANRAFIINAVKKKLGIDGFSKYSLYQGSPMGNTFSIKANGMNEQFIGIWIINFSENSQKVCIKAQFSGGSSKKNCFDMEPLATQSSNGSFDFDDDGISTLPFNLPSDEGTFRFDITEGDGRDLYILVFPR